MVVQGKYITYLSYIYMVIFISLIIFSRIINSDVYFADYQMLLYTSIMALIYVGLLLFLIVLFYCIIHNLSHLKSVKWFVLVLILPLVGAFVYVNTYLISKVNKRFVWLISIILFILLISFTAYANHLVTSLNIRSKSENFFYSHVNFGAIVLSIDELEEDKTFPRKDFNKIQILPFRVSIAGEWYEIGESKVVVGYSALSQFNILEIVVQRSFSRKLDLGDTIIKSSSSFNLYVKNKNLTINIKPVFEKEIYEK